MEQKDIERVAASVLARSMRECKSAKDALDVVGRGACPRDLAEALKSNADRAQTAYDAQVELISLAFGNDARYVFADAAEDAGDFDNWRKDREGWCDACGDCAYCVEPDTHSFKSAGIVGWCRFINEFVDPRYTLEETECEHFTR